MQNNGPSAQKYQQTLPFFLENDASTDVIHHRLKQVSKIKSGLSANIVGSRDTRELTLSAEMSADKNDSQHCRPTMLARVSRALYQFPETLYGKVFLCQLSYFDEAVILLIIETQLPHLTKFHNASQVQHHLLP